MHIKGNKIARQGAHALKAQIDVMVNYFCLHSTYGEQ